MLNTILLSLIALLFILLAFPKPLHRVLVYIQLASVRSTGAKLIVRREYVDVNTGQPFESWRQVSGWRLAVAKFVTQL
jgi:hypothetical protein